MRGGSHPADPSFLCPPGLIIDAFGELRDQQEQVKEDMEVSLGVGGGQQGEDPTPIRIGGCRDPSVTPLGPPPQTKCFICGIGSDYFDTTPHGFETHTLEEHNLANYM